MVRLEFIHLSGARRGRSAALAHLPVTLGSAAEADVQVPEAAELHALVAEEGGDLVLRDLDSGRETLLAGLPVTQAPLNDGDVIELGRGGPRLRFRRHDGPRVGLGRALRWARPEGTPERLSDTARLLRVAWREGALRTGRTVRVLAVLGLAAAAAFAGFSQYQSRRLSREVARLREALRSVEGERARFEERVAEERRRSAAAQRGRLEHSEESRRREQELGRRLQQAQGDEVRALREELEAARARLASLESERAAAERIITAYGAGVGLIQGAYAFYDAQARPLRQASDGDALGDEEGPPRLSVGGGGPVYTVGYFGTGFVVDARGLAITNRHVAEPWWKDTAAAQLVAAGFRPRFVLYRVFFPREAEPFELQTQGVSESMDLALVSFDPRGRPLPALPLDRGGRGAVAGQPVTVVGYPTGLEAIVAKADGRVVAEILRSVGTSAQRVTEELSRRGLVRPSATQGHIGDVTSTDVVFDAPSTQGGSGAPVFNKAGQVVAVEYAVLTRFTGNAFGVPVRHALELLRPVKPRRPAAD